MSDTYDALCDRHSRRGSEHELTFMVKNPDGKPSRFRVRVDEDELSTLVEHSDLGEKPSGGVGWVPVRYDDNDDGWAIAWGELESYSRET